MIGNLGFPTRLSALLCAVAAVSTAGASPILLAAVALPKAPAPKIGSGLDPNALHFVPNQGQWDARAQFLTKTPGLNVWVTRNGLVYEFRRLISTGKARKQPQYRLEGHAVNMKFVDANPGTSVTGVNETSTRVSYLSAGSSQKNLPVYKEAKTVGLYPGIDLRTYIENKSPRYDIVVKPGADPSQVRMAFEGATSVKVNGTQVQLGTRFGVRPMGGLKAFQVINGRQVQVQASFVKNGYGEVVFDLGAYDRRRELVIDPVVYSTLLGGTGGADQGNAIVVDPQNHAYVGGFTSASTFPTTFGAFDETIAGTDGFVSKMTPDGTNVIWSTFVGGAGTDAVNGIGLDDLNNVYITGQAAAGFPVTGGSPAFAGPQSDGFVAQISSDGTSMNWARFVGGAVNEAMFSLDTDLSGNVYIAGDTGSAGMASGGFDTTLTGTFDGFVAKFTGATGAPVWSSYVGGTEVPPFPGVQVEFLNDVSVDPAGNVYVTGDTNATDFAGQFTLPGNFDRSVNNQDVFVVKFDTDGTLVYGTMLGGNSGESGSQIAVDQDGFAYVTCQTTSFNYPLTPGVFDSSYNNGTDNVCTKIAQNGNSLAYSTFLGYGVGSGGTTFTPPFALDVAVDDLGAAYITGLMCNTAFPTVIPDQAAYAGPGDGRFQGDAYLQVLGSSGSTLLYSSFWGGARQDFGLGVALDGARNAYLTGGTVSAITDANGGALVGFPTTAGAFKPNYVYDGPVPPPAQPNDEAIREGFVTKLKVRIPTVIASVVIDPDVVAAGDPSAGTVTLSQPASTGGAVVTLTSDNTGVVQVPTSLFIAEGGTTANFDITTNGSISDKFIVKVTAEVEGDTKFDTITVGPWLDSLTLSNASVVGGNPVGGRVNLIKNAPQGGITVNLISTNPAVASVPATVTVPEGLNTATFNVTTTGVSTDTLVTISGSFAGATRIKNLIVKPAQLLFFNLNPSTVAGGSPSVGTVTLNGDAPAGGFNVTISKIGSPGDPFVTIPGGPVTVAAGQRTATFPITTTPAPGNTFSVLQATAGATSLNATLTISNITLLEFSVSPDTIAGGGLVTGTVLLNQAAPPGGATVDLTTSDVTLGSFVTGGPSNLILTGPTTAQITVPAGAVQATFQIQTGTILGPGNTVVTISAARGGAPINDDITITPIDITSMSISPNSVLGGQNAQMTITLTGPAPAGGVTFNITKVSQGANPPDNSANVIVNGGNPVTIAAGSSQATFPITTTSVAQTDTVRVTATIPASGFNEFADITVRAPRVVGISFTPAVVRGLTTTTMTITLDGPAPAGGANVSVTKSTNPQIANIPNPVNIPEGDTSINVLVTTNKVSRALTTNVTASYGGGNAVAALTVTR